MSQYFPVGITDEQLEFQSQSFIDRAVAEIEAKIAQAKRDAEEAERRAAAAQSAAEAEAAAKLLAAKKAEVKSLEEEKRQVKGEPSTKELLMWAVPAVAIGYLIFFRK